MKALKFKEADGQFESFAGKQPAFKSKDHTGTIVTGYKLSFKERIYILLFGKLWFSQITGNARIKPFIISINKLDVIRSKKIN